MTQGPIARASPLMQPGFRPTHERQSSLKEFTVKHNMWIVALASLSISSIPTSAMSATSATQTVTPEADRQVQTFLGQLQAGKVNAAVDGIFTTSKLWSQKTGAREQMLSQINTAISIYGPIGDYERIESQKLGTMAVREYYLVQHRDMVTRWEFDLVRGTAGWTIGYFGFADQPTNWFASQ